MSVHEVKCSYKNIFESGTVTLTAGTEDSNYPLYRIYNRDIGLLFKITAAVTMEIKVDQGASGILAADRLLIPAGHNFNGMTLDIKYSDNDSAYTAAVTQWVQSGNGLIVKEWTSETHRYWKFIITSPGSIPQLAELFLTQTYTWELNPFYPVPGKDKLFNVENTMTAGGQDRFLIHGDSKRQFNYVVPYAAETQKDNIITLNDAWEGAKPFWIYDVDNDTWVFGKLLTLLNVTEISNQKYGFEFNFIEVLP